MDKENGRVELEVDVVLLSEAVAFVVGHGFAKKNNVDFQFYSTILFIQKYLLN